MKLCSLNSHFFPLLGFLLNKVDPIFLTSCAVLPRSLPARLCPSPFLAWLHHAEGRVAMTAMTAGLKYPDDTRVGFNETPDRCLHKPAAVSAEHGRFHSERWGWLWAVAHVPGVRVAARCVNVERWERWLLLNIHVYCRADWDRVRNSVWSRRREGEEKQS